MRYILSLLIALVSALLLGKIILPILKSKKVEQEVLSYVKLHEKKSGTPTMGGFIFIIATLAAFFVCAFEGYKDAAFCVAVSLASMLVGFLDDFIKVKYGRNLGLYAYQKIIAQVIIGIAVALYAYFNFGGEVYLPFANKWFNLKWISIPLSFLAFIALTNTVNLTDGLDGLCGSVSICFSVGEVFMLLLLASSFNLSGEIARYNSLLNMTVLCLSLIGALFGYLFYNVYPAKVFMGDTGSLFLGALLSTTMIFSGLTLFILLFGIAFVISGVTDILQVCYFKATGGKRIFLMAPYHHHLQSRGMHENRIVALYVVITLICVSVAVLFAV